MELRYNHTSSNHSALELKRLQAQERAASQAECEIEGSRRRITNLKKTSKWETYGQNTGRTRHNLFN